MKFFYIIVSVLFILGCGGGATSRVVDSNISDNNSSDNNSSENNNSQVYKIMPLGDSITWDWNFDDTRTDAERSGYRNYLWYKLEDVGFATDFVGSRTTGGAIEPYFDGDNEGHEGWTSHKMADHIYGYLHANAPDIILLYIGTNDMGTSVSGVEDILNEIERFKNESGIDILVILALILSDAINPGIISEFNMNLNAMAQDRIANGDNIVVVDMEHDANITYNGPNNDFVDGVHPNDCGYEKMANVWFTVLTELESPGINYSDCK